MSEYIPNMNSKELSDECERAMKKGYWDKKLFPELIKRLVELERLQKKEVPMKPKVKIIYGGTCGINYEQHLCPTCEHSSILIGNYNDKVNNCFNCGQKIDWSE